MKYSILILSITLSFFLGRESKELFKATNPFQPTYSLDKFQPNTLSNYTINDSIYQLKETDTVYRCGQSKIYHPTTAHASFKRCKSKVYKLTVKRAKKLGMRHCKCSG